MRVVSGEGSSTAVLAASGCAVRYPSAASGFGKLIGPVKATAEPVQLPGGINYLELAGTGTNSSGNSGVRRVGVTQDAAGCRGACEIDDAWTGLVESRC